MDLGTSSLESEAPLLACLPLLIPSQLHLHSKFDFPDGRTCLTLIRPRTFPLLNAFPPSKDLSPLPDPPASSTYICPLCSLSANQFLLFSSPSQQTSTLHHSYLLQQLLDSLRTLEYSQFLPQLPAARRNPLHFFSTPPLHHSVNMKVSAIVAVTAAAAGAAAQAIPDGTPDCVVR